MSCIIRSRGVAVAVMAVVVLLSITALLAAVGPAAKITSPANKATVSGLISINAEVRGAAGLKYVVLIVDSSRPGSSNSPSCSFQVDTRELADGPHKVLVQAYDSAGVVATSRAITIYVKNAATPLLLARRPTPAKKATALAKAPAVAPAKRVAGSSKPAAPRTVAQAEDAAVSPAVAPVGGPLPEPTRTAAASAAVAKSPIATEAAAAAPPSVAAPPVVAVLPREAGRLLLNGQPLESDVVPTVLQGRLHGSFRSLFATLGAKISWLAATRTARSQWDAGTVEVPIGSAQALVNGKSMDMGAPASLRNGRTIIPVRFFANATGATLTWDAKTGVAEVRTTPRTVAKQP